MAEPTQPRPSRPVPGAAEGSLRVERAPHLVSLIVAGPAGDLEALLQWRGEAEPRLAAIVCHPHPLYGGTLHNKVVHRLATVLMDLGAAVMRFNYRGVGRSAGAYDEGEGELEDARAVLADLAARYPGARLWAAGFSFGSWIAARLAASAPAIERLVLVAPPVERSGFEALYRLPTPKLVVQGTRDELCPIERLEPEFAKWAGPKGLFRVPGATHFFDKQLGQLAHVLLEELSGPAAAATSETG